MPLRKMIRESAFNLARHDLASFLKDHEERLLAIFREEMASLDDALPEEQVFIDIKLVPLGEAILRSALHAIERFLTEEDLEFPKEQKVTIPVKDQSERGELKLKETRD
ncbi:MAG: hypothetical protein ACP5HS_04350 [Anaerolineae bacterium]